MKTPAIQIMPSLLAADFARLGEGCLAAEKAGGDQLHLDVMDGHFVKNISFGPAVVQMADRAVDLPLNVHLMISRPDLYIDAFAKAGSDTLLIHAEASCEVAAALLAIRDAGMRPGLTLNPETPVEAALDLLDDGLVDELIFMTVHPGLGGQSFLDYVLPKINTVRTRFPGLDISVDGGIDADTISRAAGAGANLFVAGTSLYRADSMGEMTNRLRALATSAWDQRSSEKAPLSP